MKERCNIQCGAPGCAHVECFAAYLEILTKGEEGERGGGTPGSVSLETAALATQVSEE